MKILHCILIFMGFILICSCQRDPKYIRLLDKQVAIFAKKAKQDDNMVLFGSGGALMDDIKLINLSFYYYEVNIDIPTARKILIKNVEDLLMQINEDNEIKPFLHSYPFTNKNLEFSISFEDKYRHDPSKEYIAAITLVNGKIVYQIAAANHRYPVIYSEFYEEGLRITQLEIYDNK